nr:hypothetical protein [Burkholderia sp. BDU5]
MIDDGVIAISDRRDEFRANTGRKYRPIGSLIDVLVGGDRYEQAIHERAGLLQMVDVPEMNDIETAVTQPYDETIRPIAAGEALQFGDSL